VHVQVARDPAGGLDGATQLERQFDDVAAADRDAGVVDGVREAARGQHPVGAGRQRRDELAPFDVDERARAVMRVINDHADRTGKKVMYAFNLTGELEQMRRRHDLVRDLGGTGVMVSLNSVGLIGMIELGRFAELPIHAHRNGWGYLSRHPMLGWSYVAWQKLWRLAGADHMHVNGLQSKFFEADESVITSARACLTPMFAAKPCLAMPVFSSGQSARQAPGTYAGLNSADLIVTAGGKNIAPQPIENEVAMSPYIAQVVMLGDKRAFPTLLVVPDFDNLSTWAKEQGIDVSDRERLAGDARVRAFVDVRWPRTGRPRR